MKISIDDLHELAKRLMFEMNEEEYETLQDEFNIMIRQMDLLGNIENIDNVEPMVFHLIIKLQFGVKMKLNLL